jgi:hypothetical protein
VSAANVTDANDLHMEKQNSQITSIDEKRETDIKPRLAISEPSNRAIFLYQDRKAAGPGMASHLPLTMALDVGRLRTLEEWNLIVVASKTPSRILDLSILGKHVRDLNDFLIHPTFIVELLLPFLFHCPFNFSIF